MSPILYRLAMLLLPTFDGERSRNNLFYAVADRDSPHYAGVRFQERVEAAFGRLLAVPVLALVFGALWYLGFDPAYYLVAFMVWTLVAVVVTTQMPFFVEMFELRGQSVETYIRAHWGGEDIDEAELANAVQLTDPHKQYRKKGAFRNDTPMVVKAMLKERRAWARRLCESQARKIEAYHRRQK